MTTPLRVELSRKDGLSPDYAPEEDFQDSETCSKEDPAFANLYFYIRRICVVILAAVLLYPFSMRTLSEKPLRDNVTVPEIDSYRSCGNGWGNIDQPTSRRSDQPIKKPWLFQDIVIIFRRESIVSHFQRFPAPLRISPNCSFHN
jgi:hypothetical protein